MSDINTVRLFYQNIGGSNQTDQSFNTTNLIATRDTYEFDILGVTEIELDTTNYCVREDFEQLFIGSRGEKIHYPSSSIKAKYKYKPGGVLMSTVGTVTRRHIGGCTDSLCR